MTIFVLVLVSGFVVRAGVSLLLTVLVLLLGLAALLLKILVVPILFGKGFPGVVVVVVVVVEVG